MGVSKENFYLGMISQVSRESASVQVENLSLLVHRNVRLESLVPNTINYFVVIDNVQGLFIGEIYLSKVNSSDSVHDSMNSGRKEDVFPEIKIDVIGLLEKDKFKLAGFKTVGIADKVYIANQQLITKYLSSLEINDYPLKDKKGKNQIDDEGKVKYQKPLDNLAQIAEFPNKILELAPNTLFDRHLMAVGTTNSGKSTSALSILDKMITSGKKVLIIDPTGEYQNTFDKNEIDKLTLGCDTKLPVGQISLSQWERIFETNENTQGATLGRAIQSLRYQKKEGLTGVLNKNGETVLAIDSKLASLDVTDTSFDITNLPKQIQAEAVQLNKAGDTYSTNSFNANTNNWLYEKVQYVLQNTNLVNFFDDDNSKNLLTKINKFVSGNKGLYIDSSNIGATDGIGTMIIDLISNHIINKKRDEIKPFVMYIDEVHRYTQNAENYTTGLISIAREGRKKGIFLFLTTQNPKDVPDVLLGQVGTMIIHRLTHSEELKAIQNLVQENTLAQIKKLNQGEAILTSINLLYDIHVHFKKSSRTHDNDTPLL
ncbi:ATP-binding protein [Fructobacillus sp. S1-1]|uniref:ATP-binding protein n=2 Tax=Fructobacillus parabroussonetiae TaxID=2713174 RepID=A0ABS5QWM7_9LACO|nr:ATP-binding protein [Fructobacillus parabroussonetiae]MBS9337526.1 ATP-binding protein [Fructobacillus parabroussonetiae]